MHIKFRIISIIFENDALGNDLDTVIRYPEIFAFDGQKVKTCQPGESLDPNLLQSEAGAPDLNLTWKRGLTSLFSQLWRWRSTPKIG